MNKTELTVVFTAGVLVGTIVTYRHAAKQYAALAEKCNRLLELDRIKTRVFEEIMPQLPEDYTLSEQTMVDIQVANMFHDNDM